MELHRALQILGVPINADQRVIVTAWRALARAVHPDTSSHPDAATLMRDLNRAREALEDHVRATAAAALPERTASGLERATAPRSRVFRVRGLRAHAPAPRIEVRAPVRVVVRVVVDGE